MSRECQEKGSASIGQPTDASASTFAITLLFSTKKLNKRLDLALLG